MVMTNVIVHGSLKAGMLDKSSNTMKNSCVVIIFLASFWV